MSEGDLQNINLSAPLEVDIFASRLSSHHQVSCRTKVPAQCALYNAVADFDIVMVNISVLQS